MQFNNNFTSFRFYNFFFGLYVLGHQSTKLEVNLEELEVLFDQ